MDIRPAEDTGFVSQHRRKATGVDIIDWIESKCSVPEGRLFGREIKLADWQRTEICRIYDNPAGTRRAILSFARKNGKTSLAALLLLVHLCGPKARPNSQLYSTAQSREQAALIFMTAAKIVRMSPALRGAVTVRDTAKELLCRGLGTRYRALSAEASTAYGLSPVFSIHDELGQVRGPRSELYEALETATGAQDKPLSIIISTQAPTDADLLSVLIDDAQAGHDPRVVCKLYTAPPEEDPFAIETIKLANPALGDFLNEEEVFAMAADAKRMPSRESEFRNLILNQRVQAESPFINPAIWKACGGAVEDIEGCDVYCGLDLSETADLTAFVMVGNVDGVWQCHCTFWLPSDGIYEKSVTDRVPYDQWVAMGLLQLTPGASIQYEYIARYLFNVFQNFRVKKIGFDRWNMKHLKPWLLRAGFSENKIAENWVEFGQGVQSMSPTIRDVEALILDRRVCHGDNPVLTMCARNSVVVRDDAGNRKLSKRKSVGRIDGMIAMLMAFGVAPLTPPVIDVNALIG